MIRWVDGHLDLAMNAMMGRDQTLEVEAIRAGEAAMDRADRGTATVSLPALRQAGAGLVVATLFARSRPGVGPADCRLRSDADYPARSIAHAAALGQLGYYRWLERAGWIEILETAEALRAWRAAPPASALGCVLLLEGADPITAPPELAAWWGWGVRIVGLAHYGGSAYAVGTGEEGPLTAMGRDLLAAMEARGMMLDLSHLSETSFREALDRFQGTVLASHAACRRFRRGNRQLGDGQIRALARRGGVIGVPLHVGMLREGEEGRKPPREAVPLRAVAEHIDHICQLTGSSAHAAIGSDLDGGFGLESVPAGLETIADLPRLFEHLASFGLGDQDVAGIAGENWLACLEAGLNRGDRI